MRASRSERPGHRRWRADNDGRVAGEVASFTRGDRTIVLRRWRRGHEQTVVLVHGIGMGQQYFGLLRDALLDRVDVIAVDLPGFGASPEPRDAVSIEASAALLADALRRLHDGAVIAVGHSMGTQVVAELAAAHPELVDRVVLIAPTVTAGERSRRTQAARLLADLRNDPPFVAIVGVKMYAQAGPRWFLKQLRAMLAHRIETVAPRVTQPALVIRGSNDRVCPHAWCARVTELLPNGRLEVAAGKGHEAMITGAQPVARMIEGFVGA